MSGDTARLRVRASRRAGLVLALVLAVDQLTKILVRSGVERGDSDPILPALDLVHTENRGVAFGAFSDSGQEIVFVIIAIALVALVAYFLTHVDQPGIWIPTGLLLGGAIGNLIDRIVEGAVTDFLKLPAWPAFNVADMAITAGVIALILVVERAGDDDGSPPPASEATDGAAGPA